MSTKPSVIDVMPVVTNAEIGSGNVITDVPWGPAIALVGSDNAPPVAIRMSPVSSSNSPSVAHTLYAEGCALLIPGSGASGSSLSSVGYGGGISSVVKANSIPLLPARYSTRSVPKDIQDSMVQVESSPVFRQRLWLLIRRFLRARIGRPTTETAYVSALVLIQQLAAPRLSEGETIPRPAVCLTYPNDPNMPPWPIVVKRILLENDFDYVQRASRFLSREGRQRLEIGIRESAMRSFSDAVEETKLAAQVSELAVAYQPPGWAEAGLTGPPAVALAARSPGETTKVGNWTVRIVIPDQNRVRADRTRQWTPASADAETHAASAGRGSPFFTILYEWTWLPKQHPSTVPFVAQFLEFADGQVSPGMFAGDVGPVSVVIQIVMAIRSLFTEANIVNGDAYVRNLLWNRVLPNAAIPVHIPVPAYNPSATSSMLLQPPQPTTQTSRRNEGPGGVVGGHLYLHDHLIKLTDYGISWKTTEEPGFAVNSLRCDVYGSSVLRYSRRSLLAFGIYTEAWMLADPTHQNAVLTPDKIARANDPNTPRAPPGAYDTSQVMQATHSTGWRAIPDGALDVVTALGELFSVDLARSNTTQSPPARNSDGGVRIPQTSDRGWRPWLGDVIADIPDLLLQFSGARVVPLLGLTGSTSYWDTVYASYDPLRACGSDYNKPPHSFRANDFLDAIAVRVCDPQYMTVRGINPAGVWNGYWTIRNS